MIYVSEGSTRRKEFSEGNIQSNVLSGKSIHNIEFHMVTRKIAALQADFFYLLRRAATFGCKRWGPSGPLFYFREDFFREIVFGGKLFFGNIFFSR